MCLSADCIHGEESVTQHSFADWGVGDEEMLDFEPLLASVDGCSAATHPLAEKIFYLRMQDGKRYISFTIEGRWLKMNDEPLMPVILVPVPHSPHQYRLFNACQGEGRWIALDAASGNLNCLCDVKEDALPFEFVDCGEQTVRLKSVALPMGWVALGPADRRGTSRLELAEQELDGLRICFVPGPQDNLNRWRGSVRSPASSIFGKRKVIKRVKV